MKIQSQLGLLLLSLFLLSGLCSADTELTNPTPIYDGNDGLSPPLGMTALRGWVLNSIQVAKSAQVEHVQEQWYTGKPPKPFPPQWISRIVRIERWKFENPRDPLVIPFSNIGVTGSAPFPGWDHQSSPAIGDSTCWIDSRMVIFVKGNTLVKLTTNSKKTGQDYTLMIARKIADSL